MNAGLDPGVPGYAALLVYAYASHVGLVAAFTDGEQRR
jgi:hypothetical protein